MDLYKELITFGGKGIGRPRQNKKNDENINKIAKYYIKLSSAMRYYLEHGKKHPSSKTITKDMIVELSRVFGPSWYQKEYNSWTESNQREWLDTFIVTKKLKADDWYHLTIDDFKEHGGIGLIDKYNSSVRQLLEKFGPVLYADHVFYEWKFKRISNWEVPYQPQCPTYDKENTHKYELFKTKMLSRTTLTQDEIPLFRRFIDWVMEQEKLSSIYKLRDGQIKNHGGAGIIASCGFKTLLELAYPEIKIKWFLVPHVQLTESYWTSEKIREALEYYCQIKNISTMDLIKVTTVDIENEGWWSLSKIGNILTLLQIGFPEIEWDPLGVSKISWTRDNRIIALKRLVEKQGWKVESDYYKFTLELAKQYNLVGLMNCYSNSPIMLLRDLLPHYDWKEWKFSKSNNCWSDGTIVNIGRIRSFFDDFRTEKNHQSLDDFTGYCVKDFPQGMLKLFNFNLYKCMTAVYPEHNWDEGKFQAVNYSKLSIRCWKELMSLIPMLTLQHKLNGGEVKVIGHPVDAYHGAKSYEEAIHILSLLPSYCIIKKHDYATNIIFQFHGTYWHAHYLHYESTKIHPTRKIECGLVYKETCDLTEELSKTHHVVEIWEHDYLNNLDLF